ncbi:hypothetical protein A6A19_00970 [Actinobacillus delphinicola]|uniref:phage major capsid protein, P2 family n=1 Tax=Actinobacillus delphinicola TaxID=51161 RepID=UPI0024434B40|nr:phage major capsid protein, P2 family [Actinobacillus delphinicola]MDG6896601.1 hypothetical protein [Actinobacillus delphinicola]
MRKETYQKLEEYSKNLAETFGVSEHSISRGHEFTVEPSMRQKLEDAVQLNSDFLSQINVVPVDEMKGETLMLGVTSSIAGRVDTDKNARQGIGFTGLTSHSYECKNVQYDTALPYVQLDMWAKFPDFANRIANQKIKRIALDRIMIGFNGTSAAKETNREENPLLQDVNIGWLENVRQNAADHVLKTAKLVKGSQDALAKYKLKANEYKTLDALVNEAKYNVIAEEFRDDTELVVLLGSDLMFSNYAPYQNEIKPTEKVAGDVIMAQKRIGGLKAVTVPFFPKNALLITRLDNLSLYYQADSTRRKWLDDAQRDRYLDLLSNNECYVVENYKAVAFVENITTLELPDSEK